ncbi:MAG TPA: hypothetical protein VNY29_12175 [Terriglobales bacterium]|jgi:integrase|nr:hypothetical protein [Terriglobales bacterium]
MPRKRKHQKGSIWLRGSSFFIRWYGSDRRQVTEFLCEKSEKHHSRTCKAVRDLASVVMVRVNSEVQEVAASPKIKDFYAGTFLPFIGLNHRHSTVDSYDRIFRGRLAREFGDKRLDQYQTSDATRFLTDCAKTLSRNSVAHVRNLMSSIFAHATATGLLRHNPIREAKVLGKYRPTKPTQGYSLGELEDLVSSLKDHPDMQLVVLLTGIMGLRPSEVAGLQWADVEDRAIHIRRAVVLGRVGGTKTEASVATLPLIEPLASLIHSRLRESQWVIPGRDGRPCDMNELAKKIRAVAGDRFKGLYAGRRAAASILTQLMGSPIAASQLLRHKTGRLTWEHYIKLDRSELRSGMKRLEETLSTKRS